MPGTGRSFSEYLAEQQRQQNERRRQAQEARAEREKFQQEAKKFMQKLITVLVIAAICLVAFFSILKIETVRGNEMGVMETWGQGVIDQAFPPKTYFLFPGFMKHMYEYDMSSRVFVMNNKTEGQGEEASGREMDAYTVQSKEGQDLSISLNLRWHIDPIKLVEIHKRVRQNIEEKLIRPVVMRVVKDEATARTAIEAYSGEGLVALQRAIQARLMDKSYDLADRGIVVENFVIEGITLDPNYINEIKLNRLPHRSP